MLGIVEAASELGVSPRRIRQMLADGALAGAQVGRVWVIEREQLRRAVLRRPPVGRPWSPASAWSVLALADGEEPDLSPVERSRARKRLAQGLESVANRLAVRSDPRCFYAHPGVLNRLGEVPEIVRAGVSASAELGVGLVVEGSFEGYVRSGDLDGIVEQFGLDDQAARPNVLLRVVDGAAWPFRRDQRAASRSVVAVDLLESDEPRARRAGAVLLGSR